MADAGDVGEVGDVGDRAMKPHWREDGEEPDPRWSLANERTLLAYTRTALALVVAGFVLAGSNRFADVPDWLAVIGLPVILLGLFTSIAGRRRYVDAQRAMRMGEPLPVPLVAMLLPWGLAVIAVGGIVVGVIALATN